MACSLGLLVAFAVGPNHTPTSSDARSSGSTAQSSDDSDDSDDRAEQERDDAEKQKKDALKRAYISQQLELYDVTVEYMDSLIDGKVPGVLFKLRNKGKKTLDQVEVTVYFKDATGAVIAEEDFHPVLVSEYSYSGDNKPLKPGYVWQMESGKFYSAKSVPSEWEEGSIDAAITDIEFAE